MPNYHRYYIPNAIIFITCVTKDRYPYLKSTEDVGLLIDTIENANKINSFDLLAYVVLPDHFHWLMTVEGESGDFSRIMHSIKRNFTWNYKEMHKVNTSLKIWQRGFWDHVIRDETDLERHLDYIHWNPIKHGYENQPEKWPFSTYKEWVSEGFYDLGWGSSKEPDNITDMDFE